MNFYIRQLGVALVPNNYNTYWGQGATYTKLSDIKIQSSTFAFVEDVDSRGYNESTWIVNWSLSTAQFGHPQSFTWQDPIPMYHGNVSTAAFVDGHAEYHKWTDPAIITYGKACAVANSSFVFTGVKATAAQTTITFIITFVFRAGSNSF